MFPELMKIPTTNPSLSSLTHWKKKYLFLLSILLARFKAESSSYIFETNQLMNILNSNNPEYSNMKKTIFFVYLYNAKNPYLL